MKIIDDENLKRRYIDKHKINNIFNNDIAPYSELVGYEKNEFLIKQGIISDYLYFLVSGEVRCYSYSEKGSVIHIGATQEFGLFGEVGSLWRKQPDTNVQINKKSVILRISLMKYRDILLNDNRFLRYICNIMASRLCKADNNISSYASVDKETRLAAYLLEINNDGDITCTLKSVSEVTFISYRHLLRLMNNFVEKGYLIKKGPHYKIIDYKGLYSASSDNYQYFE